MLRPPRAVLRVLALAPPEAHRSDRGSAPPALHPAPPPRPPPRLLPPAPLLQSDPPSWAHSCTAVDRYPFTYHVCCWLTSRALLLSLVVTLGAKRRGAERSGAMRGDAAQQRGQGKEGFWNTGSSEAQPFYSVSKTCIPPLGYGISPLDDGISLQGMPGIPCNRCHPATTALRQHTVADLRPPQNHPTKTPALPKTSKEKGRHQTQTSGNINNREKTQTQHTQAPPPAQANRTNRDRALLRLHKACTAG